ncbi:hypothetical protein LG943_21315 [Streptomonospora sp. S1-112]|uniref:Uncharacterized protein n=1 Tax=Streptomonospora mangrovi TaxID=2883123 RepID=A0A9X3SFG4_9ACTN|nr:hypothetical protein [Streptomonospora mangrovi]MDA0566833.1 hypothetical protein [Streptomonospora mangrovi]
MTARPRPQGPRRRLGLHPLAVLGLAALAVPRAVAHDLDLAGPAVNAVLVFAPIVVWIAAAVWARVPNPLLTLVAVGACYGILLGAVHLLLWTQGFGGDPPRLGGNLEGALPPAAEAALLRGFAFVSSVVTGTAVGALSGAVAWPLTRLTARRRPR